MRNERTNRPERAMSGESTSIRERATYAESTKSCERANEGDAAQSQGRSGAFLMRGRQAGKYGNRRIITEEGRFDSVREYRRWGELKLLEKAGELCNLRRQVRYELIPKQGNERAIHYTADFVYEMGGGTVCEDSKGVRTQVYRLKRRLMQWRHGIEILET